MPLLKRFNCRLVVLSIAFICEGSTCAQQQSQLDFDQVVVKAEEACNELAAFKRKNKGGLFDMKPITAYGKLADALMIRNRTDAAEKVLRHSFSEEDAKRLVATTAVKFGAPLPTIPDSIDEAKKKLWKLELIISLAHGGRYEESRKILDSHSRKFVVQLRYLKIMAANCVKNNDQTWGRKIGGLMWQNINLLIESEYEVKLDYSLYLIEMCSRLGLNDAVGKLVPIVKKQFDETHPRQKKIISSESWSRLYRRLGLILAKADNLDAASKYLNLSKEQIDLVQDKYFDRNTAHADFHLAFAEAYRLANLPKNSLEHTKQAAEWLKKIEVDQQQSTAASIDGGAGFFSAVLGLAQYSEKKEVVLAQAKLGELDTALKTWAAIPFSVQKLRCQVELADFFHKKGKDREVRDCADGCKKLVTEKATLLEEVFCLIAAAAIYHQNGQTDLRDQLISKLEKKVTSSKNEQAKQSLANELVELGLLDQANRVIASIELKRDRALPLAGLAKSLAKKSQ